MKAMQKQSAIFSIGILVLFFLLAFMLLLQVARKQRMLL